MLSITVIILALTMAALGLWLGQAAMVTDKTITVGGLTFSESLQVVSNFEVPLAVEIPNTPPGTLTTYTDTTDAVITMVSANHGIVTGNRVDVYWADPTTGAHLIQYGCVVGSVSGTQVPISSGSATSGGAPLPVQGTSVFVAPAQSVAFPITGTMVSLNATCPSECFIEFVTSGNAQVFYLHLQPGQVWNWYGGSPNPLASGSVVSVWVSHANPALAQTVQVCAQMN